jgi:transcriptional regulator with XRE-family HTH domain
MQALRYRAPMNLTPSSATPPVGTLLRAWRQRRRLSQLDLACEAEISTRHLSFVETGRSLPSREMLIHLAERLDVPLRERNALLTAAGYAPMYRERPLDDPALAGARQAVDLLLKAHEPWPALAIDRHWTLVAHNRAVAPFLAGASAALLQPPVNVLRLSLHPEGLAPRIVNLAQWKAHVLARLAQQVAASGDTVLAALAGELAGYPPHAPRAAAPKGRDPSRRDGAEPQGSPMHHDPMRDAGGVVVPLSVRAPGGGVLSMISTTTVFGTPVDITLSELALETFFPADEATAQALRRLGDGQDSAQAG